MTTHQAIAMAFPLLTAGVVGLFAYGLTKWLGRKKPRTVHLEARGIATSSAALSEPELRLTFEKMTRLMQEALEKAKTATKAHNQ